MTSITCGIQEDPKTPPRTIKNSTPRNSSHVPPPPSKRRTHGTPRKEGSSPAIGRTQSLSYYLRPTADIEMDGWDKINSGVLDSGSLLRDTNTAPPETSIASSSFIPAQSSSSVPPVMNAVPTPSLGPSPPLTTAERAAQIAKDQASNTPAAEVFLNLYESMRASLVEDFQQQYDRYQVIISGYQNSSNIKWEDAQKQNGKLRERIVTLEKIRAEERGYWEAEKKNLIRRLEQGENGQERAERLKKQEDERRNEKEEHDKTMRKYVERYDAKKKLWAKEKMALEEGKTEFMTRVTELEEENRRLEDVITNDDNMLLEQLEALETEKSERMEEFDQERAQWEADKISLQQELSGIREISERFGEEKDNWEVEKIKLQQELSRARDMVDKVKNHRGTLYWDAKKTLTDVQRENETLKETIGELTRRIDWQKKTWDNEKSIMVARLKEERNDLTALRHELYKNEAKRKREQQDQRLLFETDSKKPKIEDLTDHGKEMLLEGDEPESVEGLDERSGSNEVEEMDGWCDQIEEEAQDIDDGDEESEDPREEGAYEVDEPASVDYQDKGNGCNNIQEMGDSQDQTEEDNYSDGEEESEED